MPPRPPRRGGMGRGFGGPPPPPPMGFGRRPPPPMFGRRRPPPPPPRFGRPYRRRGCGCLPFIMVALGAVGLALALLL